MPSRTSPAASPLTATEVVAVGFAVSNRRRAFPAALTANAVLGLSRCSRYSTRGTQFLGSRLEGSVFPFRRGERCPPKNRASFIFCSVLCGDADVAMSHARKAAPANLSLSEHYRSIIGRPVTPRFRYVAGGQFP